MTCREFNDFLMDYVEKTLPEEERATFKAHLEECPDCVSYLETYQKTVDLTSLCLEDDDCVPADVPEDLLRAILEARKRQG